MVRSKSRTWDNSFFEQLDFSELVDIVRSRGRTSKQKTNGAYNEIEKRMSQKIQYLMNSFFIPGHNRDDIKQEIRFALRFKAIPDYKKEVMGKDGFYPFDKFAVLCIRRHLSTLLKTCYQNKKRTLNTSLSLDQDRSDENSEESLYLSDIITGTETTILENISNKEYYKLLFNKLYSKLSKFERKIFILYVRHYSYEEVTDLINVNYKNMGSKKRVNIKSVDNALSRMKQKAKEIFDKFGDENNK